MQTELSLAELVVRDVTGGHLSVAEEERLKAWTHENPAHGRMLSCLRDAQWRMQEWQTYKNVDKQEVWQRMQERVTGMAEETPLPPLEQRDWTIGGTIRNRIVKIWGLISTLLLYHNH